MNISIEITADNKDDLLAIIPEKFELERAIITHIEYIKQECLIDKFIMTIGDGNEEVSQRMVRYQED